MGCLGFEPEPSWFPVEHLKYHLVHWSGFRPLWNTQPEILLLNWYVDFFFLLLSNNLVGSVRKAENFGSGGWILQQTKIFKQHKQFIRKQLLWKVALNTIILMLSLEWKSWMKEERNRDSVASLNQFYLRNQHKQCSQISIVNNIKAKSKILDKILLPGLSDWLCEELVFFSCHLTTWW